MDFLSRGDSGPDSERSPVALWFFSHGHLHQWELLALPPPASFPSIDVFFFLSFRCPLVDLNVNDPPPVRPIALSKDPSFNAT